MAKIKIVGQSKVRTIKKRFKNDVGVDIQIYDQKGLPAQDDVSLSSIRTKRPNSTEMKIVGQTLVRNIETFFEENYGVSIDILNSDGSFADNDATLGAVRRTYTEQMPSKTDSDLAASGESHNRMMSIKPVEGLLVKLKFLVVDSVSEEVEDFDEPVSIEGGTLGGKLLEVHVILEPNDDSNPDGRLTMASRILQRVPMWEENDATIRDLELIQEPAEEGVDCEDGGQSEGWPGRLMDCLMELWELQRPSNDDDFFEHLDELIEVINEEGMEFPSKLYRIVGPPWSAFATSEAPVDMLAASDDLKLLNNTLVVNYIPAFEAESYKADPSSPSAPFSLLDGSKPEWHDEVDTLFIFEGYDLIERN